MPLDQRVVKKLQHATTGHAIQGQSVQILTMKEDISNAAHVPLDLQEMDMVETVAEE